MPATKCRCPELPVFDAQHPIPSKPIACSCCGEALELTCPQRCADDNARAGMGAAKRIYKPKRCVGCGNLFTPSGPRSLYCATCPKTPADLTESSDHG